MHSLSSLRSPGSDRHLFCPPCCSRIFFSQCCGFSVFILLCSLKLPTLTGSGSLGPGPHPLRYAVYRRYPWVPGVSQRWVDWTGSCRHHPEPAGKVIFGAQSLGVIGALLCERAALSRPWPSGATCPAQSLPAGWQHQNCWLFVETQSIPYKDVLVYVKVQRSSSEGGL